MGYSILFDHIIYSMFGTSRGPRNSATIRALGAVEFAIGDKVTYMKPGPRRNASGAVRSRANREANPVPADGLIISIEPGVSAAERAYGVLGKSEDESIQFNKASEITLVLRAEDTSSTEKAIVYNYLRRTDEGQGEVPTSDPTNVSGGKRSKSRKNRKNKSKKTRKGSRRH